MAVDAWETILYCVHVLTHSFIDSHKFTELFLYLQAEPEVG